MAQHVHDHGHEHHVTNTGISNRKMGFWLFLSSESVFFAALIVGYLTYAGTHEPGIGPKDIFNVHLTTISTFVLLMSSLAMVMGVNAAQRGDAKGGFRWTLITAVMGLSFLGFQVYEFAHFMSLGLTLSSSLFGTTFYVLTGFHGAHVAVGCIWLLSLLFYGRKGGLGADKAEDVEMAGLYWHYVDIVWIVLFTVVYLIEFVS